MLNPFTKPQKYDNIAPKKVIVIYGYEIFHEDILNRLIKNARSGKNAAAYIFEGTPGLHRHEAARLFAKALVCGRTDSAPCCECPACVEAQAGTHPDIVFVKPERDKASLGVDPIRDMITECGIKPFYNRHKVFIIDEGDLLTVGAQNAFLKILEEPPEYAVFIIVCANAELLLETVRSRSVIVTFDPVSDDVTRKYIEGKYPDDPRTDFLVRYCEGIPCAADELIGNEDFDTLRNEVLSLVPRLLTKNKLHAFDVADYVEKNKDNAAAIVDLLLSYLRDAMVMAMGSPESIINTDKRDKLALLVATYPASLIVAAVDEVILARQMLSRYVKASAAILHAALKTE